jgi:hypothetical protein
MEHYIPLKKDFSNFGQVIEQFRDPSVRRELTENAYRDLIASGEHSYERFVARFDATLTEAGLRPATTDTEHAAVDRAIQRRPVHRTAARYLAGASFWLYRRHPRIFQVVVAPVVGPVRALLRLIRRTGSPQPS